MSVLRIFMYLNILLIIYLKNCVAFNVNFYYNYNLHAEPFNTKIHKRELQESAVGKGSLTFLGFKSVGTVPVLFPIDICVLPLGNGTKYAAALHMGKNGVKHFVVLKHTNGSYEELFNVRKPHATAMVCTQFKNKGYVSIGSKLTAPLTTIEDASTIYEVAGDQINPHYLPFPNVASQSFYVKDQEMFLFQIVTNEDGRTCHYSKWNGMTFNLGGNIACSNHIRHMEPFSINDEAYVALANYKDVNNQLETYSEILKYSQKTQKFEVFQHIKTYGAVDVHYFMVAQGKSSISKHFLVYGNTKRVTAMNNSDVMVYVFNSSMQQFSTHQSLSSLYGIRKFLALQNSEDGTCLLLATCGEEDIKVFNMENQNFQESQVYFKGHNIRLYREFHKHFVIVTHKDMMPNEVSIYMPVFKQDQRMIKLKQQIIDWTEKESKRLQMGNLEELSMRMEEKLKVLENSGIKLKRDVVNSNINTVTTQSLIYPRAQLSDEYWKALYFINQAINILEDDLHQKQRLKRQVNGTDQHEDLESNNIDHIIETLTVKETIEANMINNINTENLNFKEIHAKKITITDDYVSAKDQRSYSPPSFDYSQDNDMLYIRNLQISGKLNDYTWSELWNNSLKRNAEIQFMKAPTKIRNLETSRIVVNHNEINSQHLGTLIPIDGGEYVINQDIQFAAPVIAKDVEINERLNNVHVLKGKLNVLLKRANETQVIEGRKSLINVKVMEPVAIAGQMLGRQFDAITPNKAIHQPISLEGDFMINADVEINEKLKTADIIDLKKKLSTKQTLEKGVLMNELVKDMKFKFLHPIKANNSKISFVNRNDLQRLVKLNQDDIQIVEGMKLFKNTLEISRGFSEVKNLNGIDMEELEKSSFLKNTNQTIKIPMKIKEIQTKSVNCSSILVNNRNITDYLTKSLNQTSKATLVVDNLKVKTFQIENLNTNQKIFQQTIQDIYRQKSRNAPTQQDVFMENQKFHGSVYVKNLILNSTINNINVEEIERNLLQLEGNIKYVGNFKFNYPMNVTQLTFYGKFNDIPATEFGRCWLQKNTKRLQEFIGPQTLTKVNAESGIHFQGLINGFTINDFYSKTYWTNRDEYLKNIIFENPIEIATSLTTQTLNHHIVPEEFLSYSDASQQIFQPLTIEGGLKVEGDGLNITFIKNINVPGLKVFLQGGYLNGLIVENAYFEQGPPSYKTLNFHSIAATLDNVWLANENVVLPQHVEVNEANFEGLLDFEGPMNNLELQFLQENYLSKTKSQNISATMVFAGGVAFADDTEAMNIILLGPIIEETSEESFNFMNFVEHTFKVNGHPYSISGNWSILEAIVDGSLNQALINDMNLVDDIIHNGKNINPYLITAPKKFKDIAIGNLITDDPSSTLQGITVSSWIKDAVYLYENFTIYGTTKMSSLNIFNNLSVLGTLNNISFNDNSLLLQDREQNIPGNLRIISKLISEKRFLTNNIENLYTDSVNSEHVPRLMDNLILFSNNVEIPNYVIFKQPLNVEKYQGPEGLLTPRAQRLKRAIQQRSPIVSIHTNKMNLDVMPNFKVAEDYLKNLTKDSFYALDHFEIRQTIDVNSTDINSFNMRTPSGFVDIMVLVDNVTRETTFYEWHPGRREFVVSQEYDWLPKNPALLKVIQKMSKDENTSLDIELLKYFISQLTMNVATTSNMELVFWNETCLIVYATLMDSPKFKITCMDFSKKASNSEIMGRASSNIQQILRLNSNAMALITNKSLEIFNFMYGSLKLSQKFSLNNPKNLMALSNFETNTTFLILATKAESSSLNHDSIQVYRSFNDGFFELWHTLPCSHLKKIIYSSLPLSKDILIYAQIDLPKNNFKVYHYEGIEGFKEILTYTILPAQSNENMQMMDIKSSTNCIISIVGDGKLTVVEIVLKKL
ncbi:uncharacterized protein LOC106085638 [Stomoxys calcitrans]|uniref:uncharacterized protein LOC106085638 n=1 Tax=Stomoxys calcitrans TaxID=35570 RepID=UPI0027E353A5|nr:uncharacterized protein LOC106085638 [Stomoxys calcitrans]